MLLGLHHLVDISFVYFTGDSLQKDICCKWSCHAATVGALRCITRVSHSGINKVKHLAVADPGCGERGGGGAHPSKQCSAGEKIDKQKKKKNKKKKGLQRTKEKKHPLRHREREARSIVAYVTFATRLIRHCMWSSMWWVGDPIMKCNCQAERGGGGGARRGRPP